MVRPRRLIRSYRPLLRGRRGMHTAPVRWRQAMREQTALAQDAPAEFLSGWRILAFYLQKHMSCLDGVPPVRGREGPAESAHVILRLMFTPLAGGR
jgi:hypothetical protein